jgi:hypothetical protein
MDGTAIEEEGSRAPRRSDDPDGRVHGVFAGAALGALVVVSLIVGILIVGPHSTPPNDAGRNAAGAANGSNGVVVLNGHFVVESASPELCLRFADPNLTVGAGTSTDVSLLMDMMRRSCWHDGADQSITGMDWHVVRPGECVAASIKVEPEVLDLRGLVGCPGL